MLLSQLFWLFLIIVSILPWWRQRTIAKARVKCIREVEEARNTRVITLIHRQEAISMLGLPFKRFIDIEDSEAVLRAIRYTPEDMPIDLVLHTPGGLVLASEQIARALKKHKGKVTVFVPHYAMSGGTLISLASDEIMMDANGVLGPIDPQVGGYPAASIIAALDQKGRDQADDRTLILGDIATKALNQMKHLVREIIQDKMSEPACEELASILTRGQWTHDYPLSCEQLQNLGFDIRCGLPREIYNLMELYPQPAQRRPSVQYIPTEYGK